MKLVAIYDNGGETLDRYTVLTDQIDKHPDGSHRDQFMHLGMSETGTGFSQWGWLPRATIDEIFNKQNGQYRTRTHLGKRVHFEQLSPETQAHIAYRLWEQ